MHHCPFNLRSFKICIVNILKCIIFLYRKNDILIGGMDNDARVQKILWVTIPYIQDDQTWCVATARPQDLWQNIFSIYTAGTCKLNSMQKYRRQNFDKSLLDCLHLTGTYPFDLVIQFEIMNDFLFFFRLKSQHGLQTDDSVHFASPV